MEAQALKMKAGSMLQEACIVSLTLAAEAESVDLAGELSAAYSAFAEAVEKALHALPAPQ